MRVVILVLLLSATGCRDVPFLPTVTPYRMDIQQGNVVTQDMVEKLQPGMSRAQVRFILGTPLVVDAFRTDRWDYVYLYKKGGQVAEQRRLIVLFKDDKLLRVDGDQMPPGPAASSTAGTVKPTAAKSEPAKDEGGTEAGKKEPQGEEKGFFGRMLEKLGF